ncbi:MAG: serine hydrolase domain-containing protein [Candidatus Limnocylindrales bacterium]
MMKLFGLDPADAVDRLQTALERSVDGETVRNAVLHVDAPRLGVERSWAGGIADERDGRPMEPETPILSASIGKLAVAATVLAFVDEGALELDAPIATVLERDVLEGLPVAGGEDAIACISARMLLANRSGLPDYFDDEVHPTADGAPSVAELMLTEPERRWTRDQLLDYVREHYAPFAAPGERFLYSDLNWDLLGLVLEGVTNRPFHEVVRERVLEPLAMTHTWYHVFERRPDGMPELADAFVRDQNITRAPSLTLDQAGGGLATTAADLGRLIRGLERGLPMPLDRLAADWTDDAMSRGLDYGYGTWRWRPGRIFFLARQLPQLVGVSGSTNSFAYLTAKDDVITGTLDQADDPSRHVRFILSRVLPLLQRAKEPR